MSYVLTRDLHCPGVFTSVLATKTCRHSRKLHHILCVDVVHVQRMLGG